MHIKQRAKVGIDESKLSDRQQEIWHILVGNEKSMDEIARELGNQVSEVGVELTMMEMGMVFLE